MMALFNIIFNKHMLQLNVKKYLIVERFKCYGIIEYNFW